VRARIAWLVVALGVLSGGCNSLGGSVPGFCGVSDDVRLAVADVPPEQYPAEAAKHVQELRDSAADLSGDQAALANKVADALEKASKTEPNSLEFTNTFNKFVRLSNRFNHKFCNETEAPDF
jgi:hypothetical protein